MTVMDSPYSAASNTLGKEIERIGLALADLATVAVLLRILARWKSKASFAGDDLMIILSLFPFYGMTAISYLGSLCQSVEPQPLILVAVNLAHFGMPITTLGPGNIVMLLKVIMQSPLVASAKCLDSYGCAAWLHTRSPLQWSSYPF